MHIQPEEGISIEFGAKIPGPKVMVTEVEMQFNYKDLLRPVLIDRLRDSHIRLHDWRRNTLFHRADNSELGWRVVDPILKLWQKEKPEFPNYKAGSNGPAAADELLKLATDAAWRPIGE